MSTANLDKAILDCIAQHRQSGNTGAAAGSTQQQIGRPTSHRHLRAQGTRALFDKGRAKFSDRDSVMLLNHKEAIEFLVDAVPTEGITAPVVRSPVEAAFFLWVNIAYL